MAPETPHPEPTVTLAANLYGWSVVVARTGALWDAAAKAVESCRGAEFTRLP